MRIAALALAGALTACGEEPSIPEARNTVNPRLAPHGAPAKIDCEAACRKKARCGQDEDPPGVCLQICQSVNATFKPRVLARAAECLRVPKCDHAFTPRGICMEYAAGDACTDDSTRFYGATCRWGKPCTGWPIEACTAWGFARFTTSFGCLKTELLDHYVECLERTACRDDPNGADKCLHHTGFYCPPNGLIAMPPPE